MVTFYLYNIFYFISFDINYKSGLNLVVKLLKISWSLYLNYLPSNIFLKKFIFFFIIIIYAKIPILLTYYHMFFHFSFFLLKNCFV